MLKIYFDKKDYPNLHKKYTSNNKQSIKDAKVLKNAYITNAGPYSIINDIYKVDAGVYSEDKKLYLESTQYENELSLKPLGGGIEFINQKVIYGGVLSPHYGHFLIESTVRLYYYLQHRNDDTYIVFSKLVNYIPQFVKDFFELLNIPDDKIIYIDKITQFSQVIVPYKSFTRSYYTNEFSVPFIEASKNIKPAQYQKIFFSRKDWNGVAKCLGENNLEKIFNKNGFKSIAMEKLSLRQQIAVIKGANVIAGINGTSFHNILFSASPKTLIMLNRNEETDCQYIINQATNADCYLIKAYKNILPVNHAHGPFIVGVTPEFKQFAQEYGLNCYNINFNQQKYLKKFWELFSETYSQNNYYQELVINNKNLVDVKLVFELLNKCNYSKTKLILYYILSKITFGKLHKLFKSKYKNMHHIKKQKMEFNY